MEGKKKRRLTEVELDELRRIMDSAPQGKKPTIRQLARYFHVNQPSIVKSLKGWKGNMRNRPPKQPKPLIVPPTESVIKIEPATTKTPEIEGGQSL